MLAGGGLKQENIAQGVKITTAFQLKQMHEQFERLDKCGMPERKSGDRSHSDRFHSARKQIVRPMASPTGGFQEREIGRRSWHAISFDDQTHFKAPSSDNLLLFVSVPAPAPPLRRLGHLRRVCSTNLPDKVLRSRDPLIYNCVASEWRGAHGVGVAVGHDVSCSRSHPTFWVSFQPALAGLP